MLKGTLAVVLTLGVLATGTARSQRADSSDLDREMRQLLSELDRAENAGDAAALASLFAEDVVLLPPGSPAVVGKTAVLEFYRTAFAQVTFEVRHEAVETWSDGALVVHWGRAIGEIRPSTGGSPTTIDTKHLGVLRRNSDNQLQFSRVMFNSNEPPVPTGK